MFKPLSRLFLLTLLIGGCATEVAIQDSAKNPQWQGDNPQKVMIVGIDERRYRTPFESTFVAELRSRGYNAVTSTAYAPVLSDLEDDATFKQVIEQSGADSIMTVKAVGFRQPNNDAWAAAYIVAALFAEDYSDYRRMRGAVSAGALADNVAAAHYGLEVQFFDVATDKMIWSAKTRTFDAEHLDDLVIKLADVLIDELIAEGII